MKLATFTWTVTVTVPDDFDETNPAQYLKALDAAWLDVQKGDGEWGKLIDIPKDHDSRTS